MPYKEKPTSKRVRLAYIVVVWIPLGAIMIAFSFLLGWWSLILWATALWATWDYWRKGDMYGAFHPWS